jgi:hypothetical protein
LIQNAFDRLRQVAVVVVNGNDYADEWVFFHMNFYWLR